MKRQTALLMSLLLVLSLLFGCTGITAAQTEEYIPVHTEEELSALFSQVKDYLDENGEPDYIKGEASWVSTLLSISPTCISATATSTERVMSTLWVTSLVWMACPPTLVDFHSSGTVQLSDKFFET